MVLDAQLLTDCLFSKCGWWWLSMVKRSRSWTRNNVNMFHSQWFIQRLWCFSFSGYRHRCGYSISHGLPAELWWVRVAHHDYTSEAKWTNWWPDNGEIDWINQTCDPRGIIFSGTGEFLIISTMFHVVRIDEESIIMRKTSIQNDCSIGQSQS